MTVKVRWCIMFKDILADLS
ncbi:hypothetical protein DOY81_002998 [Sarcophaga bullata]|nr:hypothetical protein DOY81_002998 [Sarcophaga bullata]